MPIQITCAQCGAHFQRPPSKANRPYCSQQCYGESRRGGTVIWGRYRWIYVGDVRVAEHRWIAEQSLGRPLTDNEEVHHKNEDTLDNSPDNLQVMTKAEHRREHNFTGWSIEDATAMYIEGVPIVAIAKNFGMDRNHVRRTLIAAGIHKHGTPRKRHRLSWDFDEAARLRKQGKTFAEIGKALNVNPGTLYDTMRRRLGKT